MADETSGTGAAGGAKPVYKKPGWFTKNVANPLVAGLSRLGLSMRGSRVLEVRGRTSGEPRRTPVNPLTLDGTEYLVAPRGETQWVRNLRATGGEVYLLHGRKRRHFQATEILDEDVKIPILRAYLRKWKAETGVFFDGVGPDDPDEKLRTIASRPVFRLAATA